ncbi:MAG: hypothetical protein WA425_06555, partial [Xanthobacteraceae bacterium]
VTDHFVYCAAHSLCVAKGPMIKRIIMKMESAFHFPQNRPDTISHRETSVRLRHESIESLQQQS